MRLHAQPTAEDAARAVAIDQLLLHVVGEVGRRAFCVREADIIRARQARSSGIGVVTVGDVALVEHLPENNVPSLARSLRVRHRVVTGRIAGDPGEQRRLGEAEVLGVGRVMEVRQRGLLHAICAVSEIDRVQVGGQDPVLRPTLLELPRERGFLQLPADRTLALDVGVLHELLRDRRAALDHALVAHVLPDGPHDPVHVDAAMLVEALVLDRDDRLLHQRRDVVRGHEDPALRAS